MPTRIATALRLPPDALPEYTRRHVEIWDDVRSAIRAHGGRNLTIFAAPELESVVMYVEVDDVELWQSSADTAITRAWWAHMAEIMPTAPDLSPLATDLPEIFHLD